MRGFFGGIIVGAVVMAAVAAVLSLATPLPQRPDVASDAPPGVAGAPQGDDDSGVAPVGKDADLVEAAPTAPGGQSAVPDSAAPLDDAATQSTGKPEVGEATGALADPAETASPTAPQVAAGSDDAPVSPPAPTDGPAAPASDVSASIATDPAQPAPPVVSDAGSGFGAPQVDETAPDVGSGSQSDSTPDSATAPQAQPGKGATGTQPQVATDPGAAPSAGTETGPSVTAPQDGAPSAEVATATPNAPAPEVSDAPQAPNADDTRESAPVAQADPAPTQEPSPPRTSTLPQIAGDAGATSRPGTPVVPLTERNAQETAAPASDPAADSGPEGPRLERFAEPFDVSDDKPLMAILLIDSPDSIGAEALSEFPYPLSFAVDPADPQAAQKMAAYRAAGFEVTLLANLPPAATAQDAEVAMSIWLDTLPEALAIVEGTGTGIQGNRALSDHVTEIANGEGMGLVTQSNGLNTVQKLAARAGVPSAVVFRDFDGAGQTPTVMRRFLDQAAFRAGQEGAVIMLGRVQPDTISALLLWGLQDRAQRVALSPLSAVLMRGPAGQ